MRGNTSISGKKIVEESVVESNRIWVGVVFQDGLLSVKKRLITFQKYGRGKYEYIPN